MWSNRNTLNTQWNDSSYTAPGTSHSNSLQTSFLLVFLNFMTSFVIHPGTQGPSLSPPPPPPTISNPKYELFHFHYHNPNSIYQYLLSELTSLAWSTRPTLKFILHTVAGMNSLKQKNPKTLIIFFPSPFKWLSIPLRMKRNLLQNLAPTYFSCLIRYLDAPTPAPNEYGLYSVPSDILVGFRIC